MLVLWPQAQPSTHLADVMSKTITTAFPEQALEEVDHHFANLSGLPVIDSEHKCIGVLSKKDRAKAADVSIPSLSYPFLLIHCRILWKEPSMVLTVSSLLLLICGKQLKAKVKDVMTSPAITLSANKIVSGKPYSQERSLFIMEGSPICFFVSITHHCDLKERHPIATSIWKWPIFLPIVYPPRVDFAIAHSLWFLKKLEVSNQT